MFNGTANLVRHARVEWPMSPPDQNYTGRWRVASPTKGWGMLVEGNETPEATLG